MLERQKRIARKFVEVAYSAELSSFEMAKVTERKASQALSDTASFENTGNHLAGCNLVRRQKCRDNGSH